MNILTFHPCLERTCYSFEFSLKQKYLSWLVWQKPHGVVLNFSSENLAQLSTHFSLLNWLHLSDSERPGECTAHFSAPEPVCEDHDSWADRITGALHWPFILTMAIPLLKTLVFFLFLLPILQTAPNTADFVYLFSDIVINLLCFPFFPAPVTKFIWAWQDRCREPQFLHCSLQVGQCQVW